MSKLDDELKKAVEDSEQQASEVDTAAETSSDTPGAVVISAAQTEKPRRNLGLLIGILVMGAAVLTLVMNSFEGASIYSKGVDELLDERARLKDRNVRVEGMLVKGTLVHREEPCEYRFEMEKNGQTLPVRYAGCVVPDTFKDKPGMDVQVTAEGKLAAAGHFQANKILAKCPSKYEMQERARRGEQAPHPVNGPEAKLPLTGVVEQAEVMPTGLKP